MTLKDLSSEQQDLVRLALDGKNVLCDACIGSGKTSTITDLPPRYRTISKPSRLQKNSRI